VARQFVPIVVIVVLLLSGAVFAFFEAIYLRDQFREIGEGKIALWMWVFFIVSGVFAGAAIAFIAMLFRR